MSAVAQPYDGYIREQLDERRVLAADAADNAGDPGLLAAATDEILRIHPPLVANRRRTTEPVTIGGQAIPAGERVMVLWASANRDERSSATPTSSGSTVIRRTTSSTGRACTTAPLARRELRWSSKSSFAGTGAIESGASGERVRASHPASGYSSFPIRLQ